MSDALPCGVPARLYSETPYDDRGNFHYQGDFYKAGETLPSLAARIAAHLRTHFSDARFAVRTERFSGARKVVAEVTDTPEDLSDRDAFNAFHARVSDQMHRFGFTRANPLQDYHSTAFYADVSVGRAYWAALAARRGSQNPVEASLSLGAFKSQVKVGDQMRLIAAPKGHRALGTTRTIIAVRSRDLIFEGKSYLEFPRAGAFACDGRLVRFAIGNDYEPDAHLLYEWLPRAA